MPRLTYVCSLCLNTSSHYMLVHGPANPCRLNLEKSLIQRAQGEVPPSWDENLLDLKVFSDFVRHNLWPTCVYSLAYPRSFSTTLDCHFDDHIGLAHSRGVRTHRRARGIQAPGILRRWSS